MCIQINSLTVNIRTFFTIFQAYGGKSHNKKISNTKRNSSKRKKCGLLICEWNKTGTKYKEIM